MARILRTPILILWLQLGWVSGQQKNKSGQQQVKQVPQSLTVQEEEISTLNCTFENTAFDYFLWYRQYPGKGLELLLAMMLVGSTKEDGRFKISLNVSAKHSLYIRGCQPEDAATYFCAMTQCSPDSCSPYQNLQLMLLWHQH
uniref:T cell receptor alpha variable 23/delta variable 6 n=1 Tax=Neovison vison TaxID=452646 RepID=A0A8C7BMM0_NEOVI